MENASKALIIAGAILISILIISLGIMVYNNAKDSVDGANLDQQEMEAFNSKFSAYQGDHVSGSQVNSLLQAVISSNQAEINASTLRLINVTGYITADAAAGTSTVTSSHVATGKTYNVQFTGYTNGVVSTITITAN